MAQLIIDPVTRIEGHLKIDVNIENNLIDYANLSGTMARGIENLLIGKDSRDAVYVTERICGVCFTAHGWASSIAVEKAHGTTNLPEATYLIRNLIAGGAWLHDHPLHFYHLSALDFIDITVLGEYTGADANLIKVKNLVNKEIANPPVDGSFAGPFVPTFAPDEYSIRDLDTVATLVLHYIKALEIQSKAKKMSAIFGGKQPHQSSIIPTGVTLFPSSAQRAQYREILDELSSFVNDVYVSDVLSLGTNELFELAQTDLGVGYQNYLSNGAFQGSDGSKIYPAGVVINGNLVETDTAVIEANITEDVSSAWYNSVSAGHPSISKQEFDLDKDAYSFVKAPRYNNQPMEVGPLARMIVASKQPNHPAYSHPAVQQFIGLIEAGVKPGVVARHAARALETQILCDSMYNWLDRLDELASSGETTIQDTSHWNPPTSGSGTGLTEAPRGALGHWINITNSKIGNYACVVPTTWNASPKDSNGFNGPMEEALLGCPIPDESNPINIGRIIRSFDPCLACAVHTVSPKGDLTPFLI